jgi:hypothetical protein
VEVILDPTSCSQIPSAGPQPQGGPAFLPLLPHVLSSKATTGSADCSGPQPCPAAGDREAHPAQEDPLRRFLPCCPHSLASLCANARQLRHPWLVVTSVQSGLRVAQPAMLFLFRFSQAGQLLLRGARPLRAHRTEARLLHEVPPEPFPRL